MKMVRTYMDSSRHTDHEEEINHNQSTLSTSDDAARPSTSGQNNSIEPMIPINLEIINDSATDGTGEFDAYDKFALTIAKKIKSIHSLPARIRLMNVVQDLVDNFCSKNAHDPIYNSTQQSFVYVPMVAGTPLSQQGVVLQPTVFYTQSIQPATPATASLPVHVQQITIDPKPCVNTPAVHEKKRNTPAKRSTAKPPKTKAEYQKAYREREKAKKNENKQESSAKPPKTKAEYQKEYRERQKAKKKMNKQERSAIPPKTKAEYQKEYRERQKARENENKQESTAKPPKTNAEHQKAFRERQKINKRERKATEVVKEKQIGDNYVEVPVEPTLPTEFVSLGPKPDATATSDGGETKPYIDLLEIKEEKIQDDIECSSTSISTTTTTAANNEPAMQTISGITFISDPIPIKVEVMDDTEHF